MISRNGVENNLLDIATLEPGTEYHKVAYLYDLDVGTDRLEKGFFRMFLKDIKGNIIVGRMFNLNQNDEELFLNAKTLKGRAIDMYFRVDMFNGTYNLNVSSFKLYQGLVDYSLFIGSIKNVEKSYEFVTRLFKQFGIENPKIPPAYKTDTFRELCDGKAGGYIKLLEVVSLMITSLDGIPGISREELMDTWFLVQDGYYTYLKRLSELDVISNAEKLDMLYSFKRKVSSSEVSAYAVDTFCSLIGFAKPETVQSAILVRTIDSVKEDMRLACVYNSMLPGSTRVDGGLTLLKY